MKGHRSQRSPPRQGRTGESGKGANMGKHGRATKIGVACLAGLALTAPWTVMSSPTDRARSGDDPAKANPVVRLDFSDGMPEAAFGQIPKDLVPPNVKAIVAAKVPAEIPGA